MSFIQWLGDWLRKVSTSVKSITAGTNSLTYTRHNNDSVTIPLTLESDLYVKKTGDTVTGNINSLYGVDGVETVNQFSGEMAGDDLWALRTGITGSQDPSGAQGTTSDNGFLEIATADNGTEPIYISQYEGDHMLPDSQGVRFYRQVRRATLLDEQGNTVFPGTVTAASFNGNATSATHATNANYATSAGTASKLGSVDVGSATQPIYLNDGVATACTYQLHKTVPADAVFTDTVYTHPTYTARTGKPTANQTPAFGGTVTVSQIVTDATGHVTAANDKTITIPATEASQSAAGLMSATDKSKLDGIATGAEANQNAFSNVKVGTTTVAADVKTDTLEIVAGSNVTLTPDATNDRITIAATDTVYTHPTTSGNKHIPSGGSSGQILRWSADGTATWGEDNNTVYTHPTTSGNKHIPSGGSSGQILRWSADGTAVWGAENDTIYTHPTTSGNKHIPSGGSSGQILRWSADGTATWGNDNNTTYPAFSTARYINAGGYVDAMVFYDNDAQSNRASVIRVTNGNGYHEVLIGVNNESNGAPNGLAVRSTNGTITASLPGTLTVNGIKIGTGSIGSATKPVYINAGTITAGTYELNKTVPADAKFTDTTYSGATETTDGLVTTGNQTWTGVKITKGTNVGFRVNNSDATYGCSLWMGSSGVNRGLYDHTLGKWIAYADASKCYFNGFELNKSVPADAKFTDTTYSVATSSANGLMSSTDKTALDSVKDKKYAISTTGNISVANSTDTNISSYKFTTTGVYLVHYTLNFKKQSSTGVRQLVVSNTSGGGSIDQTAVLTLQPTSTGYCFVQLTRLEKITTANTTRYLVATQTSGAAMNVSGSITVARLGDA